MSSSSRTGRAGPPLILSPTADGHGPDPAGESPRVDYLELAAALGASVLYAEERPGRLGGLEARTRRLGDWRQGWAARRSDARAFLSLAEKSALALALMDRRPHVTIAHNLTTPRRRALQRWTRWLGRLERIIVLCRAQEAYLRDEIGLATDRVRFVHDKVDHRFYAPTEVAAAGYVLSVGQTRRDYATLLEAVRTLDAPVVVVASSPWTGLDARLAGDVPAHVQVRAHLSYGELRNLYDRASVLVVPLEPGLDFAAGVNGVLEAMAMRKPLVVTSTPGIADYVRPGEDALLVPPADPVALREAITRLLSDRREAGRLATNARAVIDAGRNLDGYVAAVTSVVQEIVGTGAKA